MYLKGLLDEKQTQVFPPIWWFWGNKIIPKAETKYNLQGAETLIFTGVSAFRKWPKEFQSKENILKACIEFQKLNMVLHANPDYIYEIVDL